MKAEDGLDVPPNRPSACKSCRVRVETQTVEVGLCVCVSWVTLSENSTLLLGGFRILEVGCSLKAGVMIFLSTDRFP